MKGGFKKENMKFNFKKIISVATSAVMLGSTFGFAAAANYPAPFVESGTATGAIVVGANAAADDWKAAIDLSQGLNDKVTSSSSAASVTGEASALFSGSSKLYMNDSLSAVKTTLTDTELPTILKDNAFSGNVDTTMVQTITLGAKVAGTATNLFTFAKAPTSSDDPAYVLQTSSTQNNVIYNLTATFNKEVNLSHVDSEGEDITLFGQKFTIAAASSATSLVLLKEAEKISLDSETTPSQEVTVGGATYTVELVSASDTAATIKVTDSSGASESKEINEAASKKINGLTVAVQTADETNLKLSANIIAGAEKITLTDASAVTKGEEDTVIDGTRAEFYGAANSITSLTKIEIMVAAPSSDKDAIRQGGSFTDPTFGTLKLDFAGLNIPDTSTSREDIIVRNSGDDKMEVSMTDYNGDAKVVQYAINRTGTGMELQSDSDGRNITVVEREVLKKEGLVVVGNEDEGHLLRLSSITNQTTGYSQDRVRFTDSISGDTYDTSLTAEGTGTLTVGGKTFNVQYSGSSSDSEDDRTVVLDYPDSASYGRVVYPTIQTSKGAKVFFYKPVTINLSQGDILAANDTAVKVTAGLNVSSILLPDGDGYATTTVTAATTGVGNWSIGGVNLSTINEGANGGAGGINVTTITAGQLSYNVTAGSYINTLNISLLSPQGGNINLPAIGIFEEKDDNSVYEAIVVTTETGGTSDDGVGVDDVIRTWSADTEWDAIALYSDSKKTKDADLYGTIATVDSSDSDQARATISYPDEQVYAQIYAAEVAAAISAATVSGGLGGKVLVVKDSEASSVSDKNLIVVGGSCINTIAAKMLGSDSPICGADFTTRTQVAAGGYLIKVAASPLNAEKIAMLVAGFNKEDTTAAAAAAAAGVVTDKDTSTVYPISST